MDVRPGSPTRRLPAAVLAVGLALGAVACGTSGRELRTPDPNVPSPTRATDAPRGTAAPSAPQGANNGVFSLLTNAWSAADSSIPRQYTCDGAGQSPDLTWSSIPTGTTELALVVVDPDAGGYVHWVVTGIPAKAGSVGRGVTPAGGTERLNSAGKPGWTPPCPPKGSSHTYDFRLYALSAPADVRADTPAADAVDKLDAAAAKTAVLTGSYDR